MNLLRIALGDLKRVAKDRRAILWLLAMPLVMAYVFGSALRGGNPTTWIPVIVLDHHELAGLFIDQLRAEGYWIELKDESAQVDLKNKWPYGIVIPVGFSEAILQGHSVRIPLVKGNAAPEKILEVQSRLLHAIVRFTTALALADISHRSWNETSKTALKEALARPQLLTVTRQSHRTLRPPPSGFSQSLPGMLVMFVFQMILTYGGVTLVNDRLGGQLRRLLATPVHPFEAYAAKVGARVVLAFLQGFVLLLCGAVMFRLPLGDHPLFLVPVVGCLGVAAGALSLLAGNLCKTEKQVILVAIFGAMVLSALGGCWWPIEIVPETFKTIAKLTPSYWAMHGLQSVLYFGRSSEVLLFECPMLLGFAALFGLAAVGLKRLLAQGKGVSSAAG
ncbi:MAG TPA: ABC transporter permease [Candidatus Limnocylindrales bacterium]|jgi:ABC-2 type transport system permease protein|nr:ABC transporter permease [Candidatus Limnocylindrales bacterium]